jgi:hypothetical protein
MVHYTVYIYIIIYIQYRERERSKRSRRLTMFFPQSWCITMICFLSHSCHHVVVGCISHRISPLKI